MIRKLPPFAFEACGFFLGASHLKLLMRMEFLLRRSDSYKNKLSRVQARRTAHSYMNRL